MGPTITWDGGKKDERTHCPPCESLALLINYSTNTPCTNQNRLVLEEWKKNKSHITQKVNPRWLSRNWEYYTVHYGCITDRNEKRWHSIWMLIHKWDCSIQAGWPANGRSPAGKWCSNMCKQKANRGRWEIRAALGGKVLCRLWWFIPKHLPKAWLWHLRHVGRKELSRRIVLSAHGRLVRLEGEGQQDALLEPFRFVQRQHNKHKTQQGARTFDFRCPYTNVARTCTPDSNSNDCQHASAIKENRGHWCACVCVCVKERHTEMERGSATCGFCRLSLVKCNSNTSSPQGIFPPPPFRLTKDPFCLDQITPWKPSEKKWSHLHFLPMTNVLPW